VLTVLSLGFAGTAFVMLFRFAAVWSTTRSPIMITVAWAPPDLGMRGITEASVTHSP
jgi:hypothetical protein